MNPALAVQPLRLKLLNKEADIEVSALLRDMETQKVSSVLEFVRGSVLIFTKPGPSTPINSELEQRRAYLKRRAEEREYARMISSVKQRPHRDGFGNSLKVQFTLSANVIVAPIASFFVSYLLSRSLIQKTSHRIIAGLTGGIVMLFIELILYMARSFTIEDQNRPSSSLARRGNDKHVSAARMQQYAFSKKTPSLPANSSYFFNKPKQA
uniref:Uncharacterized protein n=1 Tax=Aureoumbra lagunensis TaxID=44058 RepID=A0A7S3NPZ3_9STRA|mmetsp:Transcript_1889/g.2861  ORF Transcript_1889/g.2861 Transcript_1889/m.2861 type:complete len:210 (+) Transcript_1889:22-651(+)